MRYGGACYSKEMHLYYTCTVHKLIIIITVGDDVFAFALVVSVAAAMAS